jgi:hypothetical protein
VQGHCRTAFAGFSQAESERARNPTSAPVENPAVAGKLCL